MSVVVAVCRRRPQKIAMLLRFFCRPPLPLDDDDDFHIVDKPDHILTWAAELGAKAERLRKRRGRRRRGTRSRRRRRCWRLSGRRRRRFSSSESRRSVASAATSCSRGVSRHRQGGLPRERADHCLLAGKERKEMKNEKMWWKPPALAQVSRSNLHLFFLRSLSFHPFLLSLSSLFTFFWFFRKDVSISRSVCVKLSA